MKPGIWIEAEHKKLEVKKKKFYLCSGLQRRARLTVVGGPKWIFTVGILAFRGENMTYLQTS